MGTSFLSQYRRERGSQPPGNAKSAECLYQEYYIRFSRKAQAEKTAGRGSGREKMRERRAGSGKIQRGGGVRVIRDGIVIAEDTIGSLQRFKDAVKEVNEGYECGIGLEKFNDLKEGDMFEVYTIEEYRD